jgi:hypothetical protein
MFAPGQLEHPLIPAVRSFLISSYPGITESPKNSRCPDHPCHAAGSRSHFLRCKICCQCNLPARNPQLTFVRPSVVFEQGK